MVWFYQLPTQTPPSPLSPPKRGVVLFKFIRWIRRIKKWKGRFYMLSVVDYPERGTGGKYNYRGNCSPKLIEDLIKQYSITNLNDFMCGSGTTEDVCIRQGIETHCLDLNRGYDMMDMEIPVRSENIFWHPPYADIIVYSDEMYRAEDIIKKFGFDPRTNDLSRCSGWKEFVSKLNYCMNKQFASLEKGGRMFVLLGDIKKKGKLYSMLCDIAKPGTLEQIIIKTQHNCMSYNRKYNGNFIPIVHEYLMVIRKDTALFYPIGMTSYHLFDMRDSKAVTWRDVLASIMEDEGALHLSEIYRKMEGHKKCEINPHWKEKIRQTLQLHDEFQSCQRGIWKLADKKHVKSKLSICYN